MLFTEYVAVAGMPIDASRVMSIAVFIHRCIVGAHRACESGYHCPQMYVMLRRCPPRWQDQQLSFSRLILIFHHVGFGEFSTPLK